MVPPSQKLVNMWRKSKLVKQTVQKVDQTKFNVQKVVKVPISDSLPRHSEHLVSCHVANHVQYAISKGLPQKKGVRPVVKKTEIKLVKGASFVNHCLSARSVPNVPNVVKEQGVGGRLQTFWPKWQELGANPRVVCILKEGYTLLFKMRPPLTRFPLIKSGYANPVRSRALSEALVALNKKLVVEKVVVRTSLSFYNRLFLVPKPNRKWRPILDLSHLNLYLKTNTFKMETPETIRVSLHKGEWVTSLDFSDAYFHIPIHPQLLFEQQGISVHSPSFRPSYGSIGVYQGGQRGEIDGSVKGYKNPPVPRRLVAQSPVSGDLPTTYPDPLGPVPRSGLGSQYEKVRTGTSTSFQFCRLPVRSSDGPGLTHGRPLEDVKGKTSLYQEQRLLYGQIIHVAHRPIDSNREASMARASPHETNSMASQKALACTGGPRQGHAGPSLPSSPSGVVVRRGKCVARSAITPSASRSTAFYRRIKRRLGRSFRRGYSKRCLVGSRRQTAHKFPRTEISPPGPQKFRASLQGPDCSGSHGQHD